MKQCKTYCIPMINPGSTGKCSPCYMLALLNLSQLMLRTLKRPDTACADQTARPRDIADWSWRDIISLLNKFYADFEALNTNQQSRILATKGIMNTPLSLSLSLCAWHWGKQIPKRQPGPINIPKPALRDRLSELTGFNVCSWTSLICPFLRPQCPPAFSPPPLCSSQRKILWPAWMNILPLDLLQLWWSDS